jgi:hypothetical protein
VGNASTSTAYPVTFPVVSTEHIAVAVESPAGAAAVSLTAAQFTISSTGGGYEIRTATAWPATARVTVFRSVPFDQPFDFQDGGAILPSQIEQGFDRVVMQVQQLWRQVTGGGGGTILPGSGGSVNSVAVFANLTAQLALKPAYVGQWGVRLSDYTAWVGKSLTTGDWEQYFAPQGLDVWSPDMVYRDDVPDFVDRWVGVVPRNFQATHLRIACNYNTGMDILWALYEGQSPQTLAIGNWTSGVTYTILVPVASWGRASGGDVLTQGTRISMTADLTGAYGTAMNGLKVDFLGRWLP